MAKVRPSTTFEEIKKTFKLPSVKSRKGNNGKLLIIGGSKLFHAAVLWSAEVASHFVDILHFCSTKENNEIFINLKSKFRDGIVVQKKNIEYYVAEDDCVLIGPGMVRGDFEKGKTLTIQEIIELTNEAEYAYYMTHFLLTHFPQKKFVIDAGAMQLMEPQWLTIPSQKVVITPHQKEFEMLFGVNIEQLTVDEKKANAAHMARKYHCIILLKAIIDIVSDGDKIVTIEGGNAGLTKGGTGDTLAGLTAALASTNDSFESAVLASFIVKSAAEKLEKTSGFWYNTTELITKIPETVNEMTKSLLFDFLQPFD